MILAGVFVAFAHGANDVSNAVGPLSAVIDYAEYGIVTEGASINLFIICACAIGIVTGLAVLGYKVMETIGEKITKITFIRGYAAQLGAAVTILFATAFAIPVSTTSVLVGSVAGTGFFGTGIGDPSAKVDMKVILKIFAGWVLTLLVGYCLTVVIYCILRFLNS